MTIDNMKCDIALANSELTLAPVSYTHLDVYKRQALSEPDHRRFGDISERSG